MGECERSKDMNKFPQKNRNISEWLKTDISKRAVTVTRYMNDNGKTVWDFEMILEPRLTYKQCEAGSSSGF